MVIIKSVKIFQFIDLEDGNSELFWLNGQLIHHTSIQYMVRACNTLGKSIYMGRRFKSVKIRNRTKKDIVNQCKEQLREYVRRKTRDGTLTLKNYVMSQCHCDLCVNELPIIIQEKKSKYPKSEEDWFDYLRVMFFCIVKQQKYVVDVKEPKDDASYDSSDDDSSDDDDDSSSGSEPDSDTFNSREYSNFTNNKQKMDILSKHKHLNDNRGSSEDSEHDEHANITRYQDGKECFVYLKDLFEYFFVHRKLLEVEALFEKYSAVDIKRMMVNSLYKWQTTFKNGKQALGVGGYWTVYDPKDDPWYDIDIPSDEGELKKVKGKFYKICGAPGNRGKCQRIGNCPSHPKVNNAPPSSSTNIIYDEVNLSDSTDDSSDEYVNEDEYYFQDDSDSDDSNGGNGDSDDDSDDSSNQDNSDSDSSNGVQYGDKYDEMDQDDAFNNNNNKKSTNKRTTATSTKSKPKSSTLNSKSSNTKSTLKSTKPKPPKSKPKPPPKSKSKSKPTVANKSTKSNNSKSNLSKKKINNSNSLNNNSNSSISSSGSSRQSNNNNNNNNKNNNNNNNNSYNKRIHYNQLINNLNHTTLKNIKISIDEHEQRIEKEIIETSVPNGLCKNYSPHQFEKDVVENYSFTSLLEQANLMAYENQLPREYTRFIILKIGDNDHLPQPAENVSLHPPPLIHKLWLTHISNTKKYKEFCSLLGSEIAVSCNPQMLFESTETLRPKYLRLKQLYVYSFGNFKFYSNKPAESYFDQCFGSTKDIWLDEL